MSQDLKQIKKNFGEQMSKLCRDLFPSLLEIEGLLSSLMVDKFDPNHSLYDDIVQNNLVNKFKNFIYDSVYKNTKRNVAIQKTPKKLLDKAGYKLYECHSERDIQKFKKYYKKGEELCTFRGGRLNNCHVFFAVKKNVNEIKRENFTNPMRQDEYGTSVISIQFARDESHSLSIKNRYNHTVVNPDATFSNDLDNIIAGLTDSFEQEYGLVQLHKANSFEIPNYVMANDGKYYRYNYEINNIYYGSNNMIIDNFVVKQFPKEKVIVLDYFLLDLQNKKMTLYDNLVRDSFIDAFNDIEKISIEKNEENKRIIVTSTDGHEIYIGLNKHNALSSYCNNEITNIRSNFLYRNTALKELKLPNLRITESAFLNDNQILTDLYVPQLEKVGKNFLYSNLGLDKIELPLLREADNCFLACNVKISEVYLPNLQDINGYFMFCNKEINELEFPFVKRIGPGFMVNNEKLNTLIIPEVCEIAENFLANNENLEELKCPKLEKIGKLFLYCNKKLNKLEMPLLCEAEDGFLYSNQSLKTLGLPCFQKVGDSFLVDNVELSELKLPLLREAGNFFLYSNKNLKTLELPNLQKKGEDFLFSNDRVKISEMEYDGKTL